MKRAKPLPNAPKIKHAAEILADNVAKLIGYDPATGRSRIPQNFGARKGVSQATIGRILRAEGKAKIHTVEVIAGFFGLEMWQLMRADFDPDNPPMAWTTEEIARLLSRLQKDPAALHYMEQDDNKKLSASTIIHKKKSNSNPA